MYVYSRISYCVVSLVNINFQIVRYNVCFNINAHHVYIIFASRKSNSDTVWCNFRQYMLVMAEKVW